jgi:hypothetical protein
MSRKQHYVHLTSAQRAECAAMLRRGTATALLQRRARILLHADTGQPGPRLSDVAIAEAVGCDARTVARVRSQFATVGFAAASGRGRRPPAPRRKLDGAAEARLVHLACSVPPDGYARWSLRLLGDQLVELKLVDAISPETVRQTLKKTRSNPG